MNDDAARIVATDGERGFVRATGLMSVGTALSRITGYLRLAAMAFALGITESRLPDAYSIANITPNILYELALGGILTSVVVPVLVEWRERRGQEAAWDAARRMLTLAAIGLSALALAAIVLAPWIVRLFTLRVGADAEAVRATATFFLRWFMPQVVFYGVGAIGGATLNVHRRFGVAMFAPILNNLVVIATFLLYAGLPGPAAGSGLLATPLQESVLAIGTTLGVVAMTVALWPAIRGLGFRFHLRPGLRDDAIRRIAGLAGWVLVYVAVNQAAYAVVLVLAAEQQGGYTAYASAFMLFQLPHAIFAVSIFTALLPGLSSRWAAGDTQAFRELLARGLRATGAIVLPAALAYLVLAREVVRVLLEHGVAGAASGDLVASILVAFAFGLVPFSLFQLLLRACYATQDTRTPALVNLAAAALNVAVNLVLVLRFELGVRGLAFGHAASYVVGSALLYLLLRRRIGALPRGSVGPAMLRAGAASVATAAVAWAAASALGGVLDTATLAGQVLRLTGAVIAGLATYAVAAMLLGVEEVRAVAAMVRRRRS
ncbi:MAG: murein biosynthesis integral membrane protein MurJ [Actinomycetota bacterium]